MLLMDFNKVKREGRWGVGVSKSVFRPSLSAKDTKSEKKKSAA
jgi:hypothetical protein